MPKASLENLTESMFYVLMVFSEQPLCGTDAAERILKRSAGRVKLGPATLYTILGKFEKEKYLRQIAVEGRKRTYSITDRGRKAYEQELERLRRCVSDSQKEVTCIE